ncbi:hypothetical protein BST61_g7034 [Cercospora zeina]
MRRDIAAAWALYIVLPTPSVVGWIRGIVLVLASERSDFLFPNTSAPHTRPGCDCRTLRPSRHSIRKIVEAGGVPILGISTGDTDKLDLYEKTYDGKTAYVAFVPADQHAVCSPDYGGDTAQCIPGAAYRMTVERIRKDTVDKARVATTRAQYPC